MSPRPFRSPALGVARSEEAIRRVRVEASDLEKRRSGVIAYADSRFDVFVSLLIDIGARKSELLERRWSQINLDQRDSLHSEKRAPRASCSSRNVASR